MTPYVIERFLNAPTEQIVPGIITKGQGGKGVVGDNPRKNVMPNGVLYELRRCITIRRSARFQWPWERCGKWSPCHKSFSARLPLAYRRGNRQRLDYQ